MSATDSDIVQVAFADWLGPAIADLTGAHRCMRIG
jgi:hypothetical protein